MKSKMKHAVSLIVLVVTILVLAILAAAVIISLSNANIMGQASQTVFKQDMANYKETYELYVINLLADNPTYDRTTLDATYQNDTNLFIKIFGEVEEKYQKGLMIMEGRLVYDTEDEVEYNILVELNMDVREKLPEVEELEKISKDESYVGYYVKIGGEYGVIFADLAVGGSNIWGVNNKTYTYNAVSDKTTLKDYVVNGTYTDSKFGTKDVLEVAGDTTGTEDRFYVMALNDITNSETTKNLFTWYYAANNNKITDYSSVTSIEFGKGKDNTHNMINKWNSINYGAQNGKSGYLDMWGVIQEKVYGENYAKENKTKDDVIWFVPSKNEWGVFGGAFGIAEGSYGMNEYYWTSSLMKNDSAWFASVRSSGVAYGEISNLKYVRLAATF